jgi:hypothetical protein
MVVFDACHSGGAVATRSLPASELMSLSAFLAQPAHWRVLLDLGLLTRVRHEPL